jgi:tetratricopeptide (TPR) repeat protein/DNA-binding CsgD family transcriptional regulator
MTNTNNKSKITHPIEIYLDYLTAINGVSLTQREIDVISCFMNGRNTKGIANFLSIAPKTVSAHISNATKKFGCDTDGMMALLANSDQFPHLKEYYTALLTDSLFKKSLKEITTLASDNYAQLNYVLVYWQKKPPFLETLENNLTVAGLRVSLEGRKEIQPFNQLVQEVYHNTCLIYFLPDALIEEPPTQPIPLETDQFHKTKIFFFPKTKKQQVILERITRFTYIDPSNWHSYYFSVFAILKKILPSLELDKIFAQFEDKATALYSHSGYISAPPPSKELLEEMNEKNVDVLQTRNILMHRKLGYALAAVLSVGLLFLWVLNRNETRTSHEKGSSQADHKNDFLNHSIRSDLMIPAETTRLDRSKLIAQIRDRLQKQSKEKIQTLALVGIGGAGKTTLARQYAQFQKIPIVWEINAETKESLASSFESLAYALCQTDEEKKALAALKDIKSSSDKEEKVIQQVRSQLKACPEWLLIYDNMEQFSNLQKYFPSDANLWGKGKVIITTQDDHVRNNSYVKENLWIGELDPDEKLLLFMKIMNYGEKGTFDLAQQESAKKLLEKIPPFPLDVSMAAYYIKATNIEPDDYGKHLIGYDHNLAAMQENILKESSDYTKTRYHIVTLSLAKLIAVDKDFTDLLLLISALDANNIPRDLMDRYKGKLVVDNFVYYLKKYSLITNSSNNSNTPLSHIYIHHSTQNIIFPYLIELQKLTKDSQLLKEVVFVLDDYLDQTIEQEDFEKMKVIVEHLEKFLAHPNLLTPFSKGLLESKLGCMYYFLNNEKVPQTIQDSFKTLKFESSKALSSEDTSRVARSLLQIGAVYTELRHDKEAKEALEKAIEIYGKEGSKNYVELSWALSYLGNLHRKLGNYEKAKDSLEKSVTLHEQYGSDNKRLARTLAYLGGVYRRLIGFQQKAIDSLEKSLELYNKDFPDEHFRIGWVLTQLGNVHRELGDSRKAKEYFDKALLVLKNHLPVNHITIGYTLACMGNCCKDLGDYQKAVTCLEQSLKIHQKYFDENHRYIGWILFHLANTYKVIGKEQEAQKLYDRVFQVYTPYREGKNIESARFLRKLAVISIEKNRLDDAENFIRRCLAILQPYNQIDVYKVFEILGDIYLKKSSQASHIESQQLKAQAFEAFNQSLKIIELNFPRNSLHIERISLKLKKTKT